MYRKEIAAPARIVILGTVLPGFLILLPMEPMSSNPSRLYAITATPEDISPMEVIFRLLQEKSLAEPNFAMYTIPRMPKTTRIAIFAKDAIDVMVTESSMPRIPIRQMTQHMAAARIAIRNAGAAGKKE